MKRLIDYSIGDRERERERINLDIFFVLKTPLNKQKGNIFSIYISIKKWDN